MSILKYITVCDIDVPLVYTYQNKDFRYNYFNDYIAISITYFSDLNQYTGSIIVYYNNKGYNGEKIFESAITSKLDELIINMENAAYDYCKPPSALEKWFNRRHKAQILM